MIGCICAHACISVTDDTDEFVKRAEYFQSENLEEVFDDLCFRDRKEKEILLAKKR